MSQKRSGATRKLPRTRILVVNAYPIFCEALGAALAIEEDLDFVGFATSTQEAVDLVLEHSPDVCVVALDLPEPGDGKLSGLETTEQIKAAKPPTRVLILAAELELDTMVRAAVAKACGFLSKNSHVSDIRAAVRLARDGGMYIEPELVPSLVDRLHQSNRRSIEGGSTRADLTAREQEVLTLLGEGLDVTTIAKHLGITLNTARGHVKNLLVKLGSHTQLEAVVEAVHQGLLPRLSK